MERKDGKAKKRCTVRSFCGFHFGKQGLSVPNWILLCSCIAVVGNAVSIVGEGIVGFALGSLSQLQGIGQVHSQVKLRMGMRTSCKISVV